MGLFNYIDTFFFISLGITFILILLLVFHFKQRILTMEHKTDTMFEIINNIVKELTMVKNSQSFFPPHSMPSMFLSNPNKKIVVSDADSKSDEEEEELESDDEEQDDEQDDEQDEYDDHVQEESEDEEQDEEQEDHVEEEIKVIKINESHDDNISLEEITFEAEPEPHITKLEETLSTTNLDEPEEKKESIKEVYRNMNVHDLKTLVIQKGLSSDTSKMNKKKLLKLLEDDIDS